MDDLIARLEAATAPSRELDVLIAQAVGEPWGAGGYSIGGNWGERAARYTASIDVALTLVPEGWHWCACGPSDTHLPIAYIVPDMGRTPWPKWVDDIEGATPAIALCIAALRARSAAP